jgi:ribosomal protein L37E
MRRKVRDVARGGAGQGALMVLPESALKLAGLKARGHAAFPGTGPAGETCGSCGAYISQRAYGGGKTFPKCALARDRWTRGSASDVRKQDPACAKWTTRAAAPPEPAAQPPTGDARTGESGDGKGGLPSFLCPRCGRRSYHPGDISERFCGVCGFVEDRYDDVQT